MTIQGQPDYLEWEADVLVIGGGMAASWAAIAAASAGASVMLVDKGYVGTSGVTATGGPGHWWVSPEGSAREEAIARRMQSACGLADAGWMERIIDTTWRTLPTLADHHVFDVDDQGRTYYPGLRGPEYLRSLRAKMIALGVHIFDHSPALELLLHDDGSVAGAQGYRRQQGQPWRARAAAVILATGGCAFLSGLLGSNTNTGDGYLMGVEAGAELSGVEFSNFHSVSPRWNSTRVLIYAYARYFDADHRELDLPPPMGGQDRALARAMLDGPVYALLKDIPQDVRAALPQIQPATPLPFVRKGIDPFEDMFEVKLFGEGTIRGTGGLRIVDDQCQTSVPGLFAAGDAATRELIAGAVSGGGSPNSAWALSSGTFSGRAAAARARVGGRRSGGKVSLAGRAGLRPAKASRPVDRRAVIRAVQDEMLPLDKNVFRSGAKLSASLEKLNAVWRDLDDHGLGNDADAIGMREAAALTATARWCYGAAFARDESRGMHQREDRPVAAADPAPRLLVSGLAEIHTRFEPHIGWAPRS